MGHWCQTEILPPVNLRFLSPRLLFFFFFLCGIFFSVAVILLHDSFPPLAEPLFRSQLQVGANARNLTFPLKLNHQESDANQHLFFSVFPRVSVPSSSACVYALSHGQVPLPPL